MTHTTDKSRVTIAGVATGLVAVVCAAVAGALLGTLFVVLFVPKTGMGWDQIADALGGLMVGGLLGVIAGIVLAVVLDVRGKLIAAVACALIAAATIGGLSVSRSERPEMLQSAPDGAEDPAVRPPTTVPH